MWFPVVEQLKEPIGSVRKYRIEESFEFNEEGTCPVKGEAEFLHTPRGILVRGCFDIKVEVTCTRCLARFTLDLPVTLEEEFFATVDPHHGYLLPPPPDPDAFVIDENQILDLGEALRQYLILNLPERRLCRPDCAGICPGCGVNLNEGPCICKERG